MLKQFIRTRELEELRDFARSSKSEFLYVRGRRRIGKSWLLDSFSREVEAFLHTGAADASQQGELRRFASRWAAFSRSQTLLELKTAHLSWHRAFSEITGYSQTSDKPIILIFDEIQWVAKVNSGFIGTLKEFWVAWQKNWKN